MIQVSLFIINAHYPQFSLVYQGFDFSYFLIEQSTH